MEYWWLIPVAYVAGSIPWGLIAVRVARRVDVRGYGSGKTGVTNVLRTAGKLPALATLAGDVGKGAGVVLIARFLGDHSALHAAVAGAAVAGHVWPIWARFRGGRGISTGFGSALALNPLAGLVGIVVFAPTVALTRYVSLGSIGAVVAVMAFFGVALALGTEPPPHFWFAVASGPLIIFMHRDNILRLLKGTERRLGESSMSSE